METTVLPENGLTWLEYKTLRQYRPFSEVLSNMKNRENTVIEALRKGQEAASWLEREP